MPTAPAPVGFIPSIPRPFVPILPFAEQDDAFGQPTPSLVNFTEFYCTSGGSNLNAGSTTDNAAIYTSTNGNWSTVTNVFTPTDGSNAVASGVSAGQFVSIYIDGASVAVFIARITNVTGGANGTITVSSSIVAGSAPVTSATTRTIKVGGAWLGPNGAVTVPVSFGISTLVGPAGYAARLNFKNDQTYTVTAALSFASGTMFYQGFTSLPGDGGKATFNMNVGVGAAFTAAGSNNTFVDLIFTTSASSNASAIFNSTGNGNVFFRCVFFGSRGSGLSHTGSGVTLLAIECEAYNCNISNTAGLGGFASTGGGTLVCIGCYSHDHTTGLNSHCYSHSSSGGLILLINSIADTASGVGVNLTASTGGVISINSDYYNISGDAIKCANVATAMFMMLVNNNFVKIGGRALNSTFAGQPGILYNNGRSDVGLADQGSFVDTHTDIFYPAGVTPWNAPTTGDFSKILAAAISAGRGAFTETDGTNTGTVSYPDIGAAQAQPVTQSFTTTGTQTLPYGYLGGHAYTWKWGFSAPVTVTVLSGSLPTGLTLSQASPTSIYITGTPTVAAVFDFTLRATSGTSTGDANFEISILSDPDEGIGGLLGGLRPTC